MCQSLEGTSVLQTIILVSLLDLNTWPLIIHFHYDSLSYATSSNAYKKFCDIFNTTSVLIHEIAKIDGPLLVFTSLIWIEQIAAVNIFESLLFMVLRQNGSVPCFQHLTQ